jgi:thioesterase domain-containing protein
MLAAARHLLRHRRQRGLRIITLQAIRRSRTSRWRPDPYPGDITLFLTPHTGSLLAKRSLKTGWETYCRRMKIVEIPGGHHNYLSSPQAEIFAKRLSAVAQAAIDKTPTDSLAPS